MLGPFAWALTCRVTTISLEGERGGRGEGGGGRGEGRGGGERGEGGVGSERSFKMGAYLHTDYGLRFKVQNFGKKLYLSN